MACLPGGRRLKPRYCLHPLSILLTFASMVILFVVVFWNAPLDQVHSTLESKAGQRMWLVTVNQTLASSTNTGLHAYGFGIWGWCEWSNSNWEGEARCTKKPFWTIDSSTSTEWDSISTVSSDFPYGVLVNLVILTDALVYSALTHLLSGMAFPLIFLPFLVFAYLIILLMALWHSRPLPPWPIPKRYTGSADKREDIWLKAGVDNHVTRASWILRDWRTHLTFFVLWVVFAVWAIAVVLAAKAGIATGQGGSRASALGLGFYGLIIAWLLFVVAQIIPMCPRMLIFKSEEKKDRSKSKG